MVVYLDEAHTIIYFLDVAIDYYFAKKYIISSVHIDKKQTGLSGLEISRVIKVMY